MHEVSLCFLWHQHQPYYPDDIGGENPMPWVRLHGTKDYWGMAMHLKEIPEMHATINLVPSLLVQLRHYTEEGREDTHLRVSRTPADGLTKEDMVYLLDNFFMVSPDQMIRPYPRYYELFQKRGISIDSAERAIRRFKPRDIVDLQVWSNLTWIHPIAFEIDPELAEFRKQGRDWTENEKLWLLDKQMQLLRQVIPLHRELQERGQLELTTTPFYHPILPLLKDKRLARRAMPDVVLPRHLDAYPEDAKQQIHRAVEYHEKLFGQKPCGMWPSEGSVAQAIVPDVAENGVQWIATDEEILSCSTDGWVSRDGNGFLRNPEMLYRPWRVEERGHPLQIVFRDHAMSDQFGFHYQRYAAHHAVDDFIGKIEAIGHATGGNSGHRPTMVNIVLDGENCWEYYPNGGLDFLRALYQRIVKHPRITPRRVSDYLHQWPATDKISHLFPGSWIQHNFGIWIGHPECNRAWDLLTQTRHHLVDVTAAREKSPDQLQSAWEEMYIAEGSDWFWWFGDDHSSAQDALFDRLFRKHLQNVYTALGEEPPSELARPISHTHRAARSYSNPTGLLDVKIDGRRTYFEWINAGRYVADGSRGTMSKTHDGLMRELYFGFDAERLLIRIDPRSGTALERLGSIETLRIAFYEPSGFELLVAQPTGREPILQLYHDDIPVSDAGVAVAVDAIVEIAIPLLSLGLSTDNPIHFFVELIEGENSVERLPIEGAIETAVPSPEYELIMWQA